MVTLQQRCFAQSLPAAALIQGLCGLQSHLEERTQKYLEKKCASIPEFHAKMKLLQTKVGPMATLQHHERVRNEKIKQLI